MNPYSATTFGLGPAGNGLNGLLVLLIAGLVMYGVVKLIATTADGDHPVGADGVDPETAVSCEEVFDNPYAEPSRPVLRLIEGQGLGCEPVPARQAR